MEVKAVAKFIRVQPRKVRIVAREIKGRPAIESAHLLKFHPSKGAFLLRKVLISAIANAQENHGLAGDALKISRINIDEGPTLKRISQRSMGRGNRINKKMSHITVVLEDYEPLGEMKPHGTKAKPRPKFEAPKKASKKAAAKATTEEAPSEVTAETENVEVVDASTQAPTEGLATEPTVEDTTEVIAEATAEGTAEENTEAEAAPETAEVPANSEDKRSAE